MLPNTSILFPENGKNVMKLPLSAIVIFTICLLIRLLFFVAVKPWDPVVTDELVLQTDAVGYHRLAVNLLEHHRYAYDGELDAIRTPLYPLFVSFHYAVFGPRPWIVLLSQILLNTATCILLFVMIRRLLNSKVAVYASLFFAVNPFFILYSVYLFSDILFAFLCVTAAYFFSMAILKGFGPGSYSQIFLSALFFGLAALVRPVAQYIPVFIIGILFILLRREVVKAIGLSAAFAVVFLLVISPWSIRNALNYGNFSLSTSGAYNLLILYVTPMEMEKRGRSFDAVEEDLYQEAKSLMIQDGLVPDELNGFEKSKYWKDLAVQYMARNPIGFIKQYMLGIFRSFANLVTSGYADMLQLRNDYNEKKFDLRAHPNIFDLVRAWFTRKTGGEIFLGIVIGFYLLISYVCLSVGLFAAWNQSNRAFLFFCVVMALYFILITGTAGLARFKLPAVPFYLSFVGVGSAYIAGNFRNKFAKRVGR